MRTFRVLALLCIVLAGGLFICPQSISADLDLVPDSATELKIVGPELVAPGKLTKLVVDSSTSVKWILADGDDDLWDSPSGSSACYFSSPTPGRYVFVVAAIVDGKLQVGRHVIVVSGAGPPPKPNPGPNPKPDPKPKDSLAQITADAVSDFTESEKPMLALIAENYKGCASRLGAGGYLNVEEFLAATVAGNRKAAGAQRDRVKQWMAPIQKKLEAMQDSGELKEEDRETYRAAWMQIYEGIWTVINQ